MGESSRLCIDMEPTEEQRVAQCSENLERMKNSIRNDDETRSIIEGFAQSVEKLQKAIGRGKILQRAVAHYLEFSEQLLSANETIESANSILALNVPQKKDLVKLDVKIRHCVENFEDNMDSVKTFYRKINQYVDEMPETNCSHEAQVKLLQEIQYPVGVAIQYIGQSIKHGEATLNAITEFNKENNVYHFGYRTILHAILLFVAVGVVVTKGIQGYETFIMIGVILYIILENSWWGYAKHKVTIAKNGIEKQMGIMRNLKERFEKLALSNSESEDNENIKFT